MNNSQNKSQVVPTPTSNEKLKSFKFKIPKVFNILLLRVFQKTFLREWLLQL